MGNRNSKNSKEKTLSKKEKQYPVKIQTEGWSMTKKHEQVLKQVLDSYNLQDVIEIILSLLGNNEIYYRFTRPNLFDISASNDFFIDPNWIKSQQQHSYGIRFVILGKHKSGKSALWMRFISGIFLSTFDPTMMETLRKQFILTKQCICLITIEEMIDNNEFSSLRDVFIGEADCIIITYDVSQPGSPIDYITPYLLYIQRLKVITTIIAGTKNDLGKSNDFLDHMDSFFDFCKQNNLCYIDISSKLDINVDFLFKYSVFRFWFDSLE
ncbi:ras family small GTPase (RAP-1) [Reticulomyxa filosa]|uniref:Ras family small GTPase (RAP-1) n=1 Tax=Reticulomyxa filosa TaxID=46433 RepID=X6M5Z1_RETFI|nr:ras family small GTPase (RAP-1) [Reticulomyxa filosa]|eukprot:ETO09344.1 ras family small GTPase (RAP-1) [Reticulomyxa filosa]